MCLLVVSLTSDHFEQYDVDGDRTLSPREFGMFLVSHVDQVRSRLLRESSMKAACELATTSSVAA
jgi:hypothetical protein